MFVWRISPYIVFLPWLTFACIDGTYLSSALTKVPYGAWFTITLATVLACLVLLWRYGKEQQWQAEATDRFPTSHFMSTDEDGQRCLSETYGSTPLSTSRGVGIFFDKAGETTPIVFSQFVLKLTSLPEVILFFHLRPLETPSVASENRYSVSHLAISNCYRLVIRYGYNDVIITPDLAKIIVDQVRMYLQSDAELPVNQVSSSPTENITDGGPDDAIPRDLTAHSSGAEKSEDECRRSACKLSKLDEAYAHKVLYIIGKEEMKIKTDASYFRKGLLHVFLWLRDNTRNKMANLGVPTDKVIEVGFLKEI
jgi:KUP system potassium uptake protein